MDHLYTPWRMSYLRGETKDPDVECVFCDRSTASPEADESNLIVVRSKFVFVILNRYPYNNGHIMVVPYKHISSPEGLEPEALLDLMLTTNRALATLRQMYQPQGFNVGANLGKVAGAGIADHFHLHIVPRWGGDANFMSIVSETRVIPDLLAETWRKFREAWPNTAGNSEPNEATR